MSGLLFSFSSFEDFFMARWPLMWVQRFAIMNIPAVLNLGSFVPSSLLLWALRTIMSLTFFLCLFLSFFLSWGLLGSILFCFGFGIGGR